MWELLEHICNQIAVTRNRLRNKTGFVTATFPFSMLEKWYFCTEYNSESRIIFFKFWSLLALCEIWYMIQHIFIFLVALTLSIYFPNKVLGVFHKYMKFRKIWIRFSTLKTCPDLEIFWSNLATWFNKHTFTYSMAFIFGTGVPEVLHITLSLINR